MQNKIKSKGGYVLLLMILLGTAIMIFLTVRGGSFTNKDANIIKEGNEAINQAKDVKSIIEQRNN